MLITSYAANICLVLIGFVFILWEDMIQHAIDMENMMETYEVVCDTTILAIMLAKLLIVVCNIDMSFGKQIIYMVIELIVL